METKSCNLYKRRDFLLDVEASAYSKLLLPPGKECTRCDCSLWLIHLEVFLSHKHASLQYCTVGCNEMGLN